MTEAFIEQGVPAVLPAELVVVIDGMVADDFTGVVGVSQNEIVDFQIRYGSPERGAERLNTLRQQAAADMQERAVAMQDLVLVGQNPDGPLPWAVTQPTTDFGTTRYPVPSATPDSTRLHYLRAHDPDLAAQIATEYVGPIIAGFRQSGYDAAAAAIQRLPLHPARTRETNLRLSVVTLAEEVAHRIVHYTQDTQLAAGFLESELGARLPAGSSLSVYEHLIQLQGVEGAEPGTYSDIYNTYVENVRQGIAGDTQLHSVWRAAVGVIARQSPERIAELVAAAPKMEKAIRMAAAHSLLAIPRTDLTSPQWTALDTTRTHFSAHPASYAELMAGYAARDGSLVRGTLAQLRQPSAAEVASRRSRPSELSVLLVSRYTPVADLARVLPDRPDLATYDAPKAIAIRRLARNGYEDLAIDLALRSAQDADTADSIQSPIKDLLAIYEEMGSGRALELAEARIAAAGDEITRYKPTAHEFATRRYIAASAQGDQERATRAAEEMVTHISTSAMARRADMFAQTVQALLDVGDLEGAAYFTCWLYNDNEIRSDGLQSGRCYDAVQNVVSAYVAASETGTDRTADAVQLLQATLLRSEPIPGAILGALKTIATRDTTGTRSLVSEHLNPLLNK